MAAPNDLPISQTYTAKPSTRNSGYGQQSDMSLGMQVSPRAPAAALANPPSSFRTDQPPAYRSDSYRSHDSYRSQESFRSPENFRAEQTFTAPLSASSSRKDSDGSFQSPQVASGPSSRVPTMHGYSPNSPSLNRNSYSMSGQPQAPRPVRSGTLPTGEHPGASMNGGAYRESRSPSIHASAGNTSSGSGSFPSGQPLEQTFEQTLGLGPSIPVQMSQDSPKDPPTMRARSGTGKSTKDKKSMFGVLSGETAQ